MRPLFGLPSFSPEMISSSFKSFTPSAKSTNRSSTSIFAWIVERESLTTAGNHRSHRIISWRRSGHNGKENFDQPWPETNSSTSWMFSSGCVSALPAAFWFARSRTSRCPRAVSCWIFVVASVCWSSCRARTGPLLKERNKNEFRFSISFRMFLSNWIMKAGGIAIQLNVKKILFWWMEQLEP